MSPLYGGRLAFYKHLTPRTQAFPISHVEGLFAKGVTGPICLLKGTKHSTQSHGKLLPAKKYEIPNRRSFSTGMVDRRSARAQEASGQKEEKLPIPSPSAR